MPRALGLSKTMTIGFAPHAPAQGLTDETFFMLHSMAVCILAQP